MMVSSTTSLSICKISTMLLNTRALKCLQHMYYAILQQYIDSDVVRHTTASLCAAPIAISCDVL
eukprot:17924-Heterococcus_DN1.PRE.2